MLCHASQNTQSLIAVIVFPPPIVSYGFQSLYLFVFFSVCIQLCRKRYEDFWRKLLHRLTYNLFDPIHYILQVESLIHGFLNDFFTDRTEVQNFNPFSVVWEFVYDFSPGWSSFVSSK